MGEYRARGAIVAEIRTGIGNIVETTPLIRHLFSEDGLEFGEHYTTKLKKNFGVQQ